MTAVDAAPTTLPVRPRTDRIWLTAAAALVLAVGFVGALLVRADGDVSLLVHAAPPWTVEADGTPGSLTVQPPEDGFDGQFFYRLGAAPWSDDRTVEGVTYDLPSLRNARWGYGALAFVVSGGDADLVPWALVALNVLAATVVGAAGAGLARTSGRHAGWGLLFVLWPGFAYSLSLDTSELVASAFVLCGLLALRHRRALPATAALAAAVVTRDTTVVVPVGILAAGVATWWSARHVARRRDAAGPDGDQIAAAGPVERGSPGAPLDRLAEWIERTDLTPTAGDTGQPTADAGPVVIDDATAQAAASDGGSGGTRPDADRGTDRAGRTWIIAGAIPLVLFGQWQLLQRARFGSLPLTSSGDNNLSAPLGGLVDQLGSLLPPAGGEEAFRLLSVAGLVALLGAAAWALPRTRALLAERLAWLPAVAVVVLLNAYLWSGATAFMRAATEAGLLSVIVLLGCRRRVLLPLAGTGLAGLWALTAIAQLSKLG